MNDVSDWKKSENPPLKPGERVVNNEREYVLEVMKLIEQHLRSIRSMLTFFVVLAIIGILIQGCSVLL